MSRWIPVALVLGVALQACLDASDYDKCVEQAENRRRVYEYCSSGWTDVCPDRTDPEVEEQLDLELGCAEIEEVPCGPAQMVPVEGECCYVVRVRRPQHDCE